MVSSWGMPSTRRSVAPNQHTTCTFFRGGANPGTAEACASPDPLLWLVAPKRFSVTRMSSMTSLLRCPMLLTLCALTALPCMAQERVIAIKAGRVIDGTGRAPIANGVVLVRGGRIDAVGPSASVAVPPDAD